MAKIIANTRGKVLSKTHLACSRCPWRGTADQALRIIAAPDGDYPYCPKCEGPCCEDEEVPAHAD